MDIDTNPEVNYQDIENNLESNYKYLQIKCRTNPQNYCQRVIHNTITEIQESMSNKDLSNYVNLKYN